MILKDVVNAMCQEGTGEEERFITIKEHCEPKRIVYRGKLKNLKDYLETHIDTKLENGFYALLKNINNFNVVEIRIDYSNLLDRDLPDYNRSKLITIM